DSITQARLESVTNIRTSNMDLSNNTIQHYMHLLASKCYEKANEFDIIHSHFTLISAFYNRLVKTPSVQTLHSSITDDVRSLLAEFKDLNYISFSHSQRRQMPELNWIANVYHGIDMEEFQFNDQPGDYLLFMGRIVEEKGPHLAIEVARELGEQIIIAGSSYADDSYWHDQIEPQIDGKQVQYIGEASNVDKIDYFRNAKALLFPIQWEEPFGLVMIEAMACGTPVIALNRGSAKEIIRDGETGFVVEDLKGLIEATQAVNKINRRACRDRVERLFSLEKMVDGYERVFKRIIE
ncbi:glycosyltransferase family 4 protein, partial [Patescibacteria group bacterium]|nr:glycosyltransferase family 4 protein [Patescibacteria group bacterium]MBU1915778.1 glycosyltransferase family 4 protein [Patescibacteria group bacterium]